MATCCARSTTSPRKRYAKQRNSQVASGSWTQSEPAVTSAESNRAAPRPIERPAQREAKALRRPFSLAGRIIARVIICQLVLTAALTTVAVLYARREVDLGFDAALNGWAINTLAAVRYTETKPPDLLFDPSAAARSVFSIQCIRIFSRFGGATDRFWRDPSTALPAGWQAEGAVQRFPA